MSNALAIATATAVLSDVLGKAVDPAGEGGVEGAQVTTLRPDMLTAADPSVPGINLFMYRAVGNASWATDDLPTRRGAATVVQPPHQALDLQYLLSFTGDEAKLEPQRLMGTAVRALLSRPVFSREHVRDVIDHSVAADPGTWHRFSDLAEQIDVVRLTWLPLDLEEFSKLWSAVLQAPYRLSVTYQATVVLIDGELTPRPALPVLTRGTDVAALQLPVITAAFADSASTDPLLSGTTLRIEGRRLRGAYLTKVRVGRLEVPVSPERVSGTRLTVDLPGGVTAGVVGVQVVHPRLVGDPPVERGGATSAAVPIMVRPTVTTAAPTPGGGSVDVDVAPPVSAHQRVVLMLNEHHPPANRAGGAYLLPVPPARPADPDPRPSLRIPVPDVAPGTYLLRVQVDGAESVLSAGDDGRFDRPRVTIP
ncbi:MAG TPA: DUF4255 domain-containing protein [Microlunatus sp.]